MSTLATELIETDSALRALAPEWEALYRRASHATPFQSPDWLLPWWHAFGTGNACAAVLRHGDRLAGVLPMYILDEPPERKLLPIGIGISDYLDVLLESGSPASAADALLRTVLKAGLQRGVTVCDLTDIPEGSPLRLVQTPPGWRTSWQRSDPAPVLKIPAGTTALDTVIPARMRRKLRMNRNRAAHRGGWHVETVTSATLEPFLRALMKLHGARWAEDGEAGVLADLAVRTFHAEAAPGLLASGMLRLCVLWMEECIAACCYALANNEHLCFYLSGFDSAFAHESPGSILIGEMIAHAIAEGCREVHFLRGGEAYKYAWGAVDRYNAACRLLPA